MRIASQSSYILTYKGTLSASKSCRAVAIIQLASKTLMLTVNGKLQVVYPSNG